MAKNLLIVESPAKAKTIEKILGKDFKVKSSFGHVRDLDATGKNKLAIDLNDGYKPSYKVSTDKLKIVKELKEEAAKADHVWLATDDDREGEAISWHLAEVLNLDIKTTKRIVFREITKPGITKAVQNPRLVDMDLVNAQQARRVLDRLVGFELSELLWKKIKPSLSAGRVQSVAVKLVVEREREIKNFNTTPFFRINAHFNVATKDDKSVLLKAELPKRFDTEEDAESFIKSCVGAAYSVAKIEVKPAKRTPAAPFTTSTLQQEASRKLYMNVTRTMLVAQKLYEAGHITYMRTDSTNLSETALTDLATLIEAQYGKKYLKTRRFKTAKAEAQEAHEAIRPTYPDKLQVSADRDEQRLYDLIWKRTVASQMSDAELERTIVDIAISTRPDFLVAEGEVIKFDGFLKVYLEGNDDDDDENTKGMLPPLKVGQGLDFQDMQGTQRFTQPPARYTEASLVKQLEERGIGRPSTYAPTISKIMEETRGYVRKENRDGLQRMYIVLNLNKEGDITRQEKYEKTGEVKGRLFASDIGMIVTDFLDEHFNNVMDYGFTAGVETKLDFVAHGKADWSKTIDEFYKPFHATLEKVRDESDRVSGERILGKDPKTGLTVLVRISKLGKPVIQTGKTEELPEGKSPQYANLRTGMTLETITLEEALDCASLPKIVGEHEGKEVLIGEGRFGPYVKFGDAFISLARGEDPYTVTLERALEVIENKQKADAPIGMYEDKPITKGSGRFGPFLKWGDLYVNIPKGKNPATLTEEECIEMIIAKAQKESTKYLQHWEAEGVAIEMGKWGPFIRIVGKKDFYRLPVGMDGKKMTTEEAGILSLMEVQKAITEQGGVLPKKAAAPKATTAKATTKTTATKTATTKATATKKASTTTKKSTKKED